MADFPTITAVPASYGLQKVSNFKTLITNFENGVEQRRAKWATQRLGFNLIYKALTYAQMTTLWDFYVARKGSYESFNFTDPITSTVYVMRFVEDNLTREEFAYQLTSSGVKLIQVF